MDWIKIKLEHMSLEYTNAELGALQRFQGFVAQFGRSPTEKEVGKWIGKKDLRNAEKTLRKFGVSLEEVQRKVEEDRKLIENRKAVSRETSRRYRAKRESDTSRDETEKRREENIHSEQSSPIKNKDKNMSWNKYEEPIVDLDGSGEIEKPAPKTNKRKEYDLVIDTIDKKYGTHLKDTRLKQYTALKKLKAKKIKLNDILNTYDDLYHDKWWKDQNRRPDLHSVWERISSRR